MALQIDGPEARLLVAPISIKDDITSATLPKLITLAVVNNSTSETQSALSPMTIDVSFSGSLDIAKNALPLAVYAPATPPLAVPSSSATPTAAGAMATPPLATTSSQIIGLPPTIAALPIGARFLATVVPMPQPGVLYLVADQTAFALTLTPEPTPKQPTWAAIAKPLSMPAAGARVEIEIRGTSTHIIARLSTVDGVPPPGKQQTVEIAPRHLISGLLHPAAAPSALLTSVPENFNASPAGLSIGDKVRATVQQSTAPPAPTISAPGHPRQPIDPILSVLPTGAQITLSLQGYGVDSATPTPTTSATPTKALNPVQGLVAKSAATVLGNSLQGDLLIKVADTVLSLETRAPFPPGTTLQFEMASERSPLPGMPLPPMPPLPTPLGPQTEFKALEETLQTLAAADPATHASTLRAAVPGGGGGAVANMIAYFLGMRSGEARQWLGERAAQTLERTGRVALLGRIGDEIRQVASGGDTQPGEWRQLQIPFHDGERVTALTAWLMNPLRTRDDDASQDSSDDDAENGTRLVVDLSLSRLGPMRFDGFYLDNRLDLTIRSESIVVNDAQANLKTVFDDVLAIAGLTGTLAFAGLAPGQTDEKADP